MHLGTNSIIGKEVTREDFDKQLLDWISAIERQVETNPFAVLASPAQNESKPFYLRIVKKILNLIGWTNFNEDVTLNVFIDKTEEDDEFKVDFFGDFESKLKSDTYDAILLTSIHDLTYRSSSKKEIQNHMYNGDNFLYHT